jgi:hypothetical protein
MPTLIDKAGNRYEYTTLTEHEDSLSLDGSQFVQGRLSDFTIDDGLSQPLINFTYPTAAAKATDITVDVAVVNPVDNSPVPVTETYYVPLMNIITNTMVQMLVIPVVDGIGQVVFSVESAGVVGINVDLIRPTPTAQFSETPDIAIY